MSIYIYKCIDKFNLSINNIKYYILMNNSSINLLIHPMLVLLILIMLVLQLKVVQLLLKLQAKLPIILLYHLFLI